MTTRILVTGSRRWWDRWALWRRLDQLLEQHGALTVVHGGAPGLDDLARQWAELRGQDEECHAANWSTWGKRAGPMRNAGMVQAGAALCLAFPDPDSKGTWDCVRRARETEIPTEVVPGRRPEVEVLCDRLLELDAARWGELARRLRYQEDPHGPREVEEQLHRALHLAEQGNDALTIRLLRPWASPTPPEVLAYRPSWIALRASGRIERRVTWRPDPRNRRPGLAPYILFQSPPNDRGIPARLRESREMCEQQPHVVLETLSAFLGRAGFGTQFP